MCEIEDKDEGKQKKEKHEGTASLFTLYLDKYSSATPRNNERQRSKEREKKKKETDMENMKEGKDESLASARRVGINRLHFSGEELYWPFLTCRGAQFMAHYTKKKEEP